jgi:putative oxidoreductase
MRSSMDFLAKRSTQVYAVLRFFAGALFACHGAQKLFGALGGHQEIHDPMGLAAGLIEFFCGLLVALGFRASIAALLASGEMAVAYFKVHASRDFWPIKNGGELAVIYCFVFLFIAAHGSGRPSLDAARRRRS